MAATDWHYDPRSRRYRDERTGRYLSQTTITTLRNAFIESQRGRMAELTGRLTNHDITVQAWEHQARQIVKEIHATEYVFGRGGRNAMTQADWGRAGHEIRDAYALLHQFTEAIAAGELSAAQVAARADSYVDGGTYAHSLGRAAAFSGVLSLPAQPGDGGTPCLARCKCEWSITEQESRWEATWIVHSAAGCDGCGERAARWSPFVQEKVAA